MTPKERRALADALSSATGQVWVASSDLPYESALCIDGASRSSPSQVAVLRVGHTYLLTPDPRGWPYARRIDIGHHVGRGWLDRLVVDAVAALRDYDAREAIKAMSARDLRRAEVYRAILRSNSGAAAAEREQARQHLARLGLAP